MALVWHLVNAKSAENMANIAQLNVEKKNALLNGKVDSSNTKLKLIMIAKEGFAEAQPSVKL